MPCALVVGALVLVATVVIGKQQQQRAGSSSLPPRRTALYIGDSLSVGKFGELLHDYLVATFGSRNVALYASCGSSPENWLRAEPTFFTKCGYREQTPSRNMAIDSRTHQATPKLDELVSRYRPTTAIVQLGTNWMDSPLPDARIRSILERFMEFTITPNRQQHGRLESLISLSRSSPSLGLLKCLLANTPPLSAWIEIGR